MRIVLSLLVLMTVAFWSPRADAQGSSCRAVSSTKKVLPAKDVGQFRETIVEFRINYKEGEAPVPGDRTGTIAFGLLEQSVAARAAVAKVPHDVVVCHKETFANSGRLFPARSIWYGMRAGVASFDDAGYVLTATVLIPAQVVEARSRAETTLKTGLLYTGEWTERDGKPLLMFTSD